MQGRGRETDRTDLALYRALFPNREARFWGSRAVVDPRITPAEVARRVPLSRTAVQSRFRFWRDSGFLLGYEVWPNPGLFGVGLSTVDIPVESPAEVDRLFEDLALVEGAISARDLLDEDGRTVRVYLVDDGRAGLERRRRLVGKVAGAGDELLVQPYWTPATRHKLSRLDWRILAFYRAYPQATLGEATAALRITAKTLSHRRDNLLNEDAMWWLMNTRSSRFPVAAFYVKLTDPSLVSSVKHALAALPSGWIPCSDGGFGLPPGPSVGLVAGLALVDSPASVDDVVREIGDYPGVAAVRWRIPRGFRSYPEWYDRHLVTSLGIDSRGDRRIREPDPDPSKIPVVQDSFGRADSFEVVPVSDSPLGLPLARTLETGRTTPSTGPPFGGRRTRRDLTPGPAI